MFYIIIIIYCISKFKGKVTKSHETSDGDGADDPIKQNVGEDLEFQNNDKQPKRSLESSSPQSIPQLLGEKDNSNERKVPSTTGQLVSCEENIDQLKSPKVSSDDHKSIGKLKQINTVDAAVDDDKIEQDFQEEVSTDVPILQRTKATKENVFEKVGVRVESDLSSGEDFKESEYEASRKAIDCEPQPESTGDVQQLPDTMPKSPQFPDANKASPNAETELDELSLKPGEKSKKTEMGRKEQKLPRRYQIEDTKLYARDSFRRRDHKGHARSERRQHHHLPSISPPPSFARRRRYHSPQPPELERRRQRRGRPSSPGPNPYRKGSRSPPVYPSPSPYPKGRSPFSGSPPPR